MEEIHKQWRESKFAELEKKKDWGYFATDQAQKDFAKYYHEQQVKNCLIADVVGSLPSDEDIQREAYIRVECWDKVNDGDEVDGGYDGFIKGCKWIIGKLRQ